MRTLWINARSEPAGYAITAGTWLAAALGWYVTIVLVVYADLGGAVFTGFCSAWLTALAVYWISELRHLWRKT